MFTTKNYMLGTVALGLVAFAVGCGGADAGQKSESTGSDEAAITALAINPVGCAGQLGTATGLFNIVANNGYINNIAIDTSSLQNATFQLSTVNNLNQTSTVNQQATIASNAMQSLINQYTNFTNAAQSLASQYAQQYAQQAANQYSNQVASNQTNQVAQHYGASTADHWNSGSNVSSGSQFASGAQGSSQFANNNSVNGAFGANSAGLSSFGFGGVASACGFSCGGLGLGANTFSNAVTSNTAFANNNTAAAQNTFFNNAASQMAANSFNNATHAAQTNSQVDVISASNVNVLSNATSTNALTSSATSNIANTAAFNSGSNASSAAQSSTSTTQQQTWAFQNLSNLQSNHMLLQVNMTALSQRTNSLVNIFANTASNSLSSSQFAVQTPVCW